MRFFQKFLDALVSGREPQILAMVFSGGGMAAIAFGALWLLAFPVGQRDIRHAEATVTRFERVPVEESKNKPPVFKAVPVVRFQAENKVVEVRLSNLLELPRPLALGDKVDVVYRAGAPEIAWIPSGFEFYFVPLSIATAGVLSWRFGAALFKAIDRKEGRG
jgi:hypothetical protein